MKGKLEYMTVDKIDEQLRRLDHRMAHSSMSLQEEKRTLDDMKRLKASRGTVQQYNDRFEKLSSDDEGRSAIVQRLQQADNHLNSIKAEEEQLREQLNDMRNREQEQRSDIPGLLQERDDCRAVINELYSKVKDIRAEHKVKVDEYFERQREFRAQQQEERKDRCVAPCLHPNLNVLAWLAALLLLLMIIGMHSAQSSCHRFPAADALFLILRPGVMMECAH